MRLHSAPIKEGLLVLYVVILGNHITVSAAMLNNMSINVIASALTEGMAIIISYGNRFDIIVSLCTTSVDWVTYFVPIRSKYRARIE